MPWNDIKNKALQSVNQVAQKADRVAQIANLHRTLQQLRQSRTAIIEQLGEHVYQTREQLIDTPESWTALLIQIQSLDDQIQQAHVQIDGLTHSEGSTASPQVCLHCQKTIETLTKFCPHCGNPLLQSSLP